MKPAAVLKPLAEGKIMRKHLDRAQKYHRRIREILMNEWDPIGVSDTPEAENEYDSYIPHIYSQLIHHNSEEEIFQNLWKIETDYMGLFGNRQTTKKVATSLVRLREQMEINETM